MHLKNILLGSFARILYIYVQSIIHHSSTIKPLSIIRKNSGVAGCGLAGIKVAFLSIPE